MASAAAAKRVILVTGANQGIGYHIVEQLSSASPSTVVLLGSRSAANAASALTKLGSRANVESLLIDVDSSESISKAVEQVKSKHGTISVLINNAGMAWKGDAFNEEVARTTLRTNYYGLLEVTNKFFPLLRPNARVINVSSTVSISSLSKMSKENKARFFSPTLTVDGLTSLLEEFCSAVAADMAGDRAPRSPEEGAKNFVDMALLPDEQFKSNGEFWENSKISTIERDSTH